MIWATRNAATATVSPSGTVTGVAPGMVIVTATADGVQGTVTVTVIAQPVASVELAPATASIVAYDTIHLTATPRAADGTALAGRTIAWTSSDPARAQISSTGIVTGISGGSATMTATVDGVSATATITASAIAFTDIRAGGQHTCALAGTVPYCWGDNNDGELGDGTKAFTLGTRRLPFRVGGGHQFASIHPSGASTCGLESSGKAWCWGLGTSGQLGIGDAFLAYPFNQVTVATAVLFNGTFSEFAVGQGTHACGISTGATLCWGANYAGQTGAAVSPSPAPIGSSLTFTRIWAGANHTCGLRGDGAAYCWGDNNHGELGDSSPGPNISLVPRLVAGGLQFSSLALGAYFSCGFTASGQAYCWGSNRFGALGSGSNTLSASSPQLVVGGHVFTDITAGFGHACGITIAGAAYCWGMSYYGALGNGSFNNPLEFLTAFPVPVSGGLTFARISAGGEHTCGLTTDRHSYCWGLNNNGQLGTGDLIDGFAPRPVLGQ